MATLTSDDIFFILAGLPRETLLTEVQALGIVFEGVRPGKLDIEEIAECLTENFFKSTAAAARIGAAVDHFYPAPNLAFLKSPKAYQDYKRSLSKSDPDTLSAYLWHLSKDSGPEARQALKTLMDFMKRSARHEERAEVDVFMTNVVERAKLSKDLEIRLKKSEETLAHRDKRILELGRLLDETRHKGERLEASLGAAREEARRLKNELAAGHPSPETDRRMADLQAAAARGREEAERLEAELARAREKLRRQGHLKRVGVFLDVQNLLISAKEAFGAGLDFAAVHQKAEAGGEESDRLVVSALAYLAEDPLEEKAGLKTVITRAGFTLRLRPIIRRIDGSSKGDWDLGMAVEVLDFADRLDVVVLGTGDADFEDLVRFLKDKKPHLQVEILCLDSPRHTSERLLKAADRVLRLGPRHTLAPAPVSANRGRPLL